MNKTYEKGKNRTKTQESRKSGVRCQKTDDGCRKFKKDFQTDDVKNLEEI